MSIEESKPPDLGLVEDVAHALLRAVPTLRDAWFAVPKTCPHECGRVG